MRPPRINMAPSGTMARSRISRPVRGRHGPARVTSWRQFRTASSAIFGEASVHRSTKGFIVDGIKIDVYVFARAGFGGRSQSPGDRQIGGKLGRRLEAFQAGYHGGGPFQD